MPPGEEVFYGQKPDRKEAFDVPIDVPADDPDVLAGKSPFLGPVQWPDDPAFKEHVAAYYGAVSELARRLFSGFALALDLAGDLVRSIPLEAAKPAEAHSLSLFAADAPADEPGIGAHTDYECFTILLPTAPGLEVMNGEGEWIDAPPIEGAFVINIGDMLEAWSNGTFVATSHRVRKVKEERYSFPYFATCDYHTIVSPLPQFVTAERPAKFKPTRVGGSPVRADGADVLLSQEADRGRHTQASRELTRSLELRAGSAQSEGELR